jgi:hypothetical protein
MKMYRVVKPMDGWRCMKMHITALETWRFDSYTDLKIKKTNVTSVSYKSNFIAFNYHVGDRLVLSADCVNDCGVMLDYKLF